MDPKHDRALDLLLAGRAPSEVAAEVGVCRETVWRWTKDPDFAAELEARRAELRETTAAAMADGTLEAVRVLREAMGPAAPWPVRLRAAVALLDRTGHRPGLEVAAVLSTEDKRELEEVRRLRAMTEEELETEARRLLEARDAPN